MLTAGQVYSQNRNNLLGYLILDVKNILDNAIISFRPKVAPIDGVYELCANPNPIFFPQPMGFGPSYTRLGFLQIAPTVAWEITDRVSIGFSPTINVADAQASPFPFAPTNADFSYSPATGNRSVWGIGAQAGIFYESPDGVNLGFSIKSPQWFSRFKFANTFQERRYLQ